MKSISLAMPPGSVTIRSVGNMGARFRFLSIVPLLLLPIPGSAEIVIRSYHGFTLWIDCERNGPVFFLYNVGADVANRNDSRYPAYKPDPDLPPDCQPSSTDSYRVPADVTGSYDRGHIAPLNHVDSYEQSALDSRYMVNLMPQTSRMNRGAWKETEEVTECYRELNGEHQIVTVFGGVLWGDNRTDDYFVESHSVATPDSCWKTLIRDGESITWLVPNKHGDEVVQPGSLFTTNLDRHITSIAEVEAQGGYIPIVVSEALRSHRAAATWSIPQECDPS